MKKQYLVHIDELSSKYKNLYRHYRAANHEIILHQIKAKILNDNIKPICINKAEWYI